MVFGRAGDLGELLQISSEHCEQRSFPSGLSRAQKQSVVTEIKTSSISAVPLLNNRSLLQTGTGFFPIKWFQNVVNMGKALWLLFQVKPNCFTWYLQGRKQFQLNINSWKRKFSAWMNKACQKHKAAVNRDFVAQCGEQPKLLSVQLVVQLLEICPQEPFTGLGQGEMSLCLRCVWCTGNKMAEINRSFQLQVWCFGFPRSGGHTMMKSYFSCYPSSTLSFPRIDGMSGMKKNPFSCSRSHL